MITIDNTWFNTLRIATHAVVRYPTTNFATGERGEIEVSYDPSAPCRICGLPVMSASMGGTDVCPPCDCGRFRPGGAYAPEVKALLRSYGFHLKREDLFPPEPALLPEPVFAPIDPRRNS